MDQRQDIRQNLLLNVAVYHDDKLITRCSSGNVSRGGIFLRTQGINLPTDTPLKLKIEAECDDDVIEFNFNTHVVYTKRRGLGLAFKETRAELSRVLMGLLSKQKVPAMGLNDTGINGAGAWYPFKPLNAEHSNSQLR